MAITWTESLTFHTSAALAAGASTNDVINLGAGPYDFVECRATFVMPTRPTAGNIVIQVYPTCDAATTYPTNPMGVTLNVPFFKFRESLTVVEEFAIDRVPRAKIVVTNSTDVALTSYEGKYAGGAF